MKEKRPSPTLLRRAAPAPAATQAAAASPPPAPPSPPTPVFPPGFALPRYGREALVLSLFPQLAQEVPDLDSPLREAAASSSSFVPDSQPDADPRGSSAAPGAADAERRVRFALNATLLESTPPAPIQGALRPCIKSTPDRTFSLPLPSSPALHAPPAPSVCEGASSDEGWQLVRPPYWWRTQSHIQQHSRRRSSATYSSSSRAGFVILKHRVCHRCLDRGHCKASCRNPFRCLRCRRFGHRARHCSNPPAWRCRSVDGEARSHDHHEPAIRRREDRDRHDGGHDDDDVRRGRRDGQEGRRSSSRDRIFRSSSRAPERRRDDDRRDSRRDDRRDSRRNVRGDGESRMRDRSEVAGWRRDDDQVRDRRDDDDDRGRRGREDRSSSCASWFSWIAPCFGAQVRPAVVCPATLHQDASPRTTMLDIIELHPTPAPVRPCGATTPPLMPAASASHGSPAAAEAEPTTPIFIPMSTPPVSPAANNSADPPTQPPLFVPCAPPLLSAPSSTPPRPPKTRRKTLAGVSGFNLNRCSPRLQAKKRTMPVAQMAEKLLCQRMGIINEGQEVTEEAISKFVAMFQGQLPDITVSALRALFNLDCDLAKAVEDALVEHGGAAGTELQAANGEVAGEAA